jgi:hypothetical protein
MTRAGAPAAIGSPRARWRRRVLALAAISALGLASVACMRKPASPPDVDPGAGAAALKLVLRPIEVDLTAAPGVRLLRASAMTAASPAFGGFSAIEVSGDGARIVAISDAGSWLSGALSREDGLITALVADGWGPLHDASGAVQPDEGRDAEGLALGPDGALTISFERDHRVSRYAASGGAERVLRRFGPEAGFGANSGFEALAMRPDGALLAILEAPRDDDLAQRALIIDASGSGSGSGLESGLESVREIEIAKPLGLRIVGADIDAEGRLWVVERGFTLIGGFFFELAVLAPEGTGYGPRRFLGRVQGAGADNAEGLAVWRDADGATRLLVVSDDNFMPFQRNILYEFAVDAP